MEVADEAEENKIQNSICQIKMSVSFKGSDKTASSVRRERLETLTSLFQQTDEFRRYEKVNALKLTKLLNRYSQGIGGEIIQHTRDANMNGVLRASNNNGLVNALTLGDQFFCFWSIFTLHGSVQSAS